MKCLLFLFYMFLITNLFGQKQYRLECANDQYKAIKKHIDVLFRDSIDAKKYISELQNLAIKKGYLLSSIDSILYLENKIRFSFYLGQKFGETNLSLDKNELLYFKNKLKYSEKFYSGIPFSTHQIASILKKMQLTLENDGYPFSSVKLDSLCFEGVNLSAKIKVQRNQMYVWKTIHIKGDSAVSKRALLNIIRIKEGDVYSQDELRLISKRLKQINYIKETKQHEVLFTKDGAELYIYVRSNHVSSANGAIGLQPNPLTGKVSLTGDLSLKLMNVVKRGELFELNWKSLQTQTQSLKSHLNYPFIFKSPFGVDALFDLYKRDTTYLELKMNFGVQYFLKGGNYFKFFIQKDASNILSGGKNNPQFSNLNTVNSISYGLALLRRQIDYLPNPSKGIVINAEILIGNRRSRETDSSEIEKLTTYKFDFMLEWFFPIYKRHVVRLSNQTSSYFAPSIYQNEVFRFGGLNQQRGFNEDELFATTKSVFGIEYRFLVDQNSRFVVFCDQSWYENNAIKYYKDSPFGFGAGFSFGTTLGIFSISYAQGKQFNNPILLKNGKIHFGYVAYF